MRPIVTIIIPVYNGEKTIKEAIVSCLGQTLKNIEVLIIDNGSTDQTNVIVNQFNDPRVNYFYLTQKGRSLARNTGLKRARGRYIQFLDADDLLLPKKLERAVNYLERHPAVKGYVCGIDYENEAGKLQTLFPHYDYENELLAHNVFPIHSLVFRYDNQVIFDENLSYCEDWLFWVEELYGETLYFDSQEIGGIIRIHDDNTMKQVDKMNEYQLYVQQLLKSRYKQTKELRLNELKLVILHCYTKEKEQLTIDILNKQSKITYNLIKLITSLPIISQLGRRKIEQLTDKKLY